MLSIPKKRANRKQNKDENNRNVTSSSLLTHYVKYHYISFQFISPSMQTSFLFLERPLACRIRSSDVEVVFVVGHIAPFVSFSLAETLPAQTTDLYLWTDYRPFPFTIRYVLKGCIVWPFMNIHVFACLGKMFALLNEKITVGGWMKWT